jgi:hypothetical protein
MPFIAKIIDFYYNNYKLFKLVYGFKNIVNKDIVEQMIESKNPTIKKVDKNVWEINGRIFEVIQDHYLEVIFVKLIQDKEEWKFRIAETFIKEWMKYKL